MEAIQNNLNRGKHIQPKGNIITESHGAILVARIDGGPHALPDDRIYRQPILTNKQPK